MLLKIVDMQFTEANNKTIKAHSKLIWNWNGTSVLFLIYTSFFYRATLSYDLRPYAHLWSWAMGHDQVQTAEMGFLRRLAGVSLRDGVRSSAIWEGLGVELLL